MLIMFFLANVFLASQAIEGGLYSDHWEKNK